MYKADNNQYDLQQIGCHDISFKCEISTFTAGFRCSNCSAKQLGTHKFRGAYSEKYFLVLDSASAKCTQLFCSSNHG